MDGPLTNVDAYLAQVDPAFVPALYDLRALILTVAPKAEEGISYGVPSYTWNGPLVAFGAAKKHCAFYGMSPKVLDGFKSELKGFSTSPGTIRFTPDRRIPEAIVRAIVEARMDENIEIAAARTTQKIAARKMTSPKNMTSKA